MNINIPRSSEKKGKGDICIMFLYMTMHTYVHTKISVRNNFEG